MYKSYLKIAWRNLVRHTGYSFINIGGLSAGIVAVMLIGLWVYDELSYNRYHRNHQQLAQVMLHETYNGVTETGPHIPMPLRSALAKLYGSDFTHLSLSSWTSEHILSHNDKKIVKTGNYVQSDFPEMMTFRITAGTIDGLSDPASIMLSESTARALFASQDAIGQMVAIDGGLQVKVTGVYEDLPHNSSFRELHFISSWELRLSSWPWLREQQDNWALNGFQLFAQLAPESRMDVVSEKISRVKASLAGDEEAVYNPVVFLHPMKDWRLRSEWTDGRNTGGKISVVWLFATIGLIILLLACINFMNLSTARSESRAREVGVRMSMGSLRGQLINQFLSESFLVVLLSFVLSTGIVSACMPWFNTLADKQIVIPLTDPYFWVISAAVIFLTSLMAGFYPALYISSFNPVRILKGTFKTGRSASVSRKALVIVQFTASVTLIIGTVVVYNQIQFSKDRPAGYDREALIMMQMKSAEFYEKYDVLRTSLISAGGAVEVSAASSPVTEIAGTSSGFEWPGKAPGLTAEFAYVFITPQYGKTIGWTIKDGRDLSAEFTGDSNAVILNEAAVTFMGINDPLGMEIRWGDRALQVAGIIHNMVMESPYGQVKPTVYLTGFNHVNWIHIRLNPARGTGESLESIASVVQKIIPSAPFDYKFADQEYASKFDFEERFGQLVSAFSIIAIAISCLGLFGLISFVATKRTKEIGIRKVLGASVAQVWRLLSRDFVSLVLISCLIAVPLSIYIMQQWLMQFEYRTLPSWHIFAITIVAAIVVTLLIVSIQTIKAAGANPVDSLRSE